MARIYRTRGLIGHSDRNEQHVNTRSALSAGVWCHGNVTGNRNGPTLVENQPVLLRILVGATGFEPATPCAQGRCATRLRYAPTSGEEFRGNCYNAKSLARGRRRNTHTMNLIPAAVGMFIAIVMNTGGWWLDDGTRLRKKLMSRARHSFRKDNVRRYGHH